MGRVENRIVLITGAARGQGRSHAIRLAQEGADIIALDICQDIDAVLTPLASREDLDETAAAVQATGRRVIAEPVDVRDLPALKQVVDRAVGELGGLDAVVANAGVLTLQRWDQVTPEIWDAVIGTNLTGVWNTCSVTAPHLIDRGGGSLILISSVAGIKGQPFLLPYVAAKHGVVGLMKSLTNELARHSVRVNTIHPTGVNTQMGGTEGGAKIATLLEEQPDLGPLLLNSLPVQVTEPEDISNAVLFLASDEARYVTGLQMKVDAGATSR
jgi:SDR family mycofactocin-dependent oxidoreductase